MTVSMVYDGGMADIKWFIGGILNEGTLPESCLTDQNPNL
jgi:hypothetical protein